MTRLVKYEAALAALAECKSVDEVKGWIDMSAAMQAYRRMAGDKTLEIDAAEIRIRSERRLGELIIAQKASVGLSSGARMNGAASGKNDGSSAVVTHDRRPKLADVGVSKDLSARAQAIAAVPQKDFEREVGEWRTRVKREGERVTARLVKKSRKVKAESEKPSAEVEALKARIADLEERLAEMTEIAETAHTLLEGEAANEIANLKAQIRGLKSQVNELLSKNVQLVREVKRYAKKAGVRL